MKKIKFKRYKTESLDKFVRLFFEKKPNFVNEIVKEESRYYLLPKQISKIKEEISRSTLSAGLFIGEIIKREFYPSLAFIELLSKESNKKVFLEKKAEWLFLCGRDIFLKSVEKQNVQSGYVFIQNMKDENLGIGVFKTKEILNLLDKGDFLRREK